jgi:hypothetical protein
MFKHVLIMAATAGLLVAKPVYATTQCTISLANIFSGDGGYIWLAYTNGGSSYLTGADPDREATLSLATTALVTSRSMTVRYAADSVPCTSVGRSDLIGIYLN